jgi:hypothetical protein
VNSYSVVSGDDDEDELVLTEVVDEVVLDLGGLY